MVSYESVPIPQFTNQSAYQSVFAPPGFSFDSPFAYPSISSSQPQAESQPMPSGQHRQQQQHVPLGSGSGMSMPESTGMEVDHMSSRSGSGSGSGTGIGAGHPNPIGLDSGLQQSNAMGMQGGMVDPWKSVWPTADGIVDKRVSPSLQ